MGKDISIPDMRLYAHHLFGKGFDTCRDAVSALGAVQAQDYPAAKWSLGLRMKSANDKQIGEAFNRGEILRTHIMRPTWHFVVPEDLQWMQHLTSSRVRKLIAPRHRRLGISDKMIRLGMEILRSALRGKNYMTRNEISAHMQKKGISAKGPVLARILMEAEIACLICSGPRRGKQFTYALAEERIPKTRLLSREQALSRLALKYFSGHGPAQLKDFAWWSGLTARDAMLGIEGARENLSEREIHGKKYWMLPDTPVNNKVSGHKPSAFLLSVFDEYFIGYRDRSDVISGDDSKKLPFVGNALLTSLMVINGNVVGTWKRTIKKNRMEIRLSPFRKLEKSEIELIHKAAEKYSSFFGMGADVRWLSNVPNSRN